MKNRNAFRIGVVAEATLDRGHVLRSGDFSFRKPCWGILPRDIEKYLGRPLARKVTKNSSFHPEDFG